MQFATRPGLLPEFPRCSIFKHPFVRLQVFTRLVLGTRAHCAQLLASLKVPQEEVSVEAATQHQAIIGRYITAQYCACVQRSNHMLHLPVLHVIDHYLGIGAERNRRICIVIEPDAVDLPVVRVDVCA